MQESKTYQYQMEKAARENAIKYILAALRTKFPADTVNAITPIIQNISDLQRLEELHTAAVKAQKIEAFTQMLNG